MINSTALPSAVRPNQTNSNQPAVGAHAASSSASPASAPHQNHKRGKGAGNSGAKHGKDGAKLLSNGFAFPIKGKPHVMGTPHVGTHTLGNWQSDNAVDLGARVGTPIYATKAGRIRRLDGNNANPNGRFNGYHFELNGKHNAWFYTHMSKAVVKDGERVKRGELVGYSGSANGVPHLHIGQERGNPMKSFKLLRR